MASSLPMLPVSFSITQLGDRATLGEALRCQGLEYSCGDTSRSQGDKGLLQKDFRGYADSENQALPTLPPCHPHPPWLLAPTIGWRSLGCLGVS